MHNKTRDVEETKCGSGRLRSTVRPTAYGPSGDFWVGPEARQAAVEPCLARVPQRSITAGGRGL